MTSEQRVKEAYPKACAARYKDNGGESYYLIWTGWQYSRDSRRLGEGKTASSAWVDAAKRLKGQQ